jgi:hypothetical protein
MPSIQDIFSRMPEKERTMLNSDRSSVEQLGRSEDLLAATRSGFPFGTLVVTPTRLVVYLQDGGVEVTKYADVSSFDLIEGTKKLLGKYSDTMLNTRFRNGTHRTGQVLGREGGDWPNYVGRVIIAAHQQHTLDN